MTKTFRFFPSRKDQNLMGFAGSDAAALLQTICTNSATGYVRQSGEYVMVPRHQAEKVAAHLEAQGWTSTNG